MSLEIAVDDPTRDDVRTLLGRHLGFARGTTPAEFSFALEADQLVDRDVTFFSARESGRLVGIAALRRLDATHGELKSMHTAQEERGRGVGRALVAHILAFARQHGYRRVSLETGTQEEFVPARTLYASAGFTPCGPFGGYEPSDYNTFMTMELEDPG